MMYNLKRNNEIQLPKVEKNTFCKYLFSFVVCKGNGIVFHRRVIRYFGKKKHKRSCMRKYIDLFPDIIIYTFVALIHSLIRKYFQNLSETHFCFHFIM